MRVKVATRHEDKMKKNLLITQDGMSPRCLAQPYIIGNLVLAAQGFVLLYS